MHLTIVNSLINSNQKIINRLKEYHELSYNHSVSVALVATRIGLCIGLKNDEVNEIGLGALLHDIGKTKVPLEILNKPASLTDSEYQIIKQHPLIGAKILLECHSPPNVVSIVLQHHERLNGSGYPFGLNEKSIRFESQIVAVADVFAALTENRPYGRVFNFSDALKIIIEGKNHFFLPNLVESLNNLYQKNYIY